MMYCIQCQSRTYKRTAIIMRRLLEYLYAGSLSILFLYVRRLLEYLDAGSLSLLFLAITAPDFPKIFVRILSSPPHAHRPHLVLRNRAMGGATGGFWGPCPPFFIYSSNVLQICPQNVSLKCIPRKRQALYLYETKH